MGKRSYKELLKESIIKEFDASQYASQFNVKGPMLDAIISYRGDGELTTHQDAASILERYYYGENAENGVDTMDASKNEIPAVPTENSDKALNEIEDEIEPSKPDGDSSAVLIKSGPEGIEEDLENTVLERLISELEEQEQMEDEPEKEKTEKDIEPKDVEDLDVDKELKENLPGFKSSTGYKMGSGGSVRVGDEIEEAFQLFQEQIENEEDEEDDEKKEEEKVAEQKRLKMKKKKMVKEQDEEDEEKLEEQDELEDEEKEKVAEQKRLKMKKKQGRMIREQDEKDEDAEDLEEQDELEDEEKEKEKVAEQRRLKIKKMKKGKMVKEQDEEDEEDLEEQDELEDEEKEKEKVAEQRRLRNKRWF
jgi:hypothetical protein